MADGKIQLIGGEQLKVYLKALPEKMMEKVVRQSLTAGIRKIQDRARARCPILDLSASHGGSGEPGFLLQNIRIRTGRKGDEMRARCGITREAFYGHFVEFGTRHAPAYPFMRPAADEAAGAAAQQVVDTAIAKAEKELGKAR